MCATGRQASDGVHEQDLHGRVPEGAGRLGERKFPGGRRRAAGHTAAAGDY